MEFESAVGVIESMLHDLLEAVPSVKNAHKLALGVRHQTLGAIRKLVLENANEPWARTISEILNCERCVHGICSAHQPIEGDWPSKYSPEELVAREIEARKAPIVWEAQFMGIPVGVAVPPETELEEQAAYLPSPPSGWVWQSRFDGGTKPRWVLTNGSGNKIWLCPSGVLYRDDDSIKITLPLMECLIAQRKANAICDHPAE